MTATLVRVHPSATASGTGTTAATAISIAAVPVGNVLIAAVGAHNDTTVVLSRPGDETASWVKIAESGGINQSLSIELWAIKTTVTWALGESVTATFTRGGAPYPDLGFYRSIQLMQFTGVDVVVRGAAAQTSTTSPPFDATVDDAFPGDLVLAAAVSQNLNNSGLSDPGFTFVPDADTTRGTWQNAGTAKVSGQGWNTGVTYRDGLLALLEYKIPTGEGSQTFTVTLSPQAGSAASAVVVLRSAADPPNAPALTTMASGGTINRGVTNQARWLFSDPNYADSQSKFDLRYRVVGDPTWTTVSQSTPNWLYDFAAGLLAAGDYEWQVRTYDSIGLVGPYSSSGFFTAADQPDGPTITYPTAGQSVDQFEHVTWSTPVQEKYQVRRVADDAGDPDPGTIYFDSGPVVDTTTRTVPLEFETNNRVEHVQLRVYADGLWSDWVDVPVDVSYTRPPTPAYLLYPDPSDGSLLILITNPEPGEDEPAAIYNRILINDSAEGLRVDRNGTNVSPNGVWRYRVPVSGYSYMPDRLIVEAVADNGTTSRSAT